jgi:hypothetical protein
MNSVSHKKKSRNKPYISVAFANRNDGYGGDLENRIKKFIDYYAYYTTRWPNIFEFVICDWNPPTDRPKLRDAFPWTQLGQVVHVEVPPEVHQKVAGARGRKILDYIARNVCIRHARGQFILLINQDIFISESILNEIACKKLSDRAFYRADRCDFHFEPCSDVPPKTFEAAALQNVFMINRRYLPDNRPISIPTTMETVVQDGLRIAPGDAYDPERGVITNFGAIRTYRADRYLRRILSMGSSLIPLVRRWMPDGEFEAWKKQYLAPEYYRQFFLHTNGSGDFIIAPRKAFYDIQGMIETTDFYMHLDSYAILQLFSAGYKQIIFAQPHRVFHADHDRSDRADFEETITWAEHEVWMSKIIRNKNAYKINGPNWGLISFDINAII